MPPARCASCGANSLASFASSLLVENVIEDVTCFSYLNKSA